MNNLDLTLRVGWFEHGLGTLNIGLRLDFNEDWLYGLWTAGFSNFNVDLIKYCDYLFIDRIAFVDAISVLKKGAHHVLCLLGTTG